MFAFFVICALVGFLGGDSSRLWLLQTVPKSILSSVVSTGQILSRRLKNTISRASLEDVTGPRSLGIGILAILSSVKSILSRASFEDMPSVVIVLWCQILCTCPSCQTIEVSPQTEDRNPVPSQPTITVSRAVFRKLFQVFFGPMCSDDGLYAIIRHRSFRVLFCPSSFGESA